MNPRNHPAFFPCRTGKTSEKFFGVAPSTKKAFCTRYLPMASRHHRTPGRETAGKTSLL
jgi:hypothetical protein